MLLSLFERVVSEQRPHLVTVIGQAGVGKSRLLRELARPRRAGSISPAAVRLGNCPAYGAGLAYWALAEVVRGTFDIVDTDDACDGLAQAQPRDRGPGRRRPTPRSRPSGSPRPSAGRSASSRRPATAPSRSSTRTRSRCATGCSRPCGRWSRRPDGASR